jgi:uncharacterized membrane protein
MSMHDEEPSATFTVCIFPTATGAERMLGILEGLQDRGTLVLDDLAVTTWPGRAARPTCWQELPPGRHAFPGAFWDELLGALPLPGRSTGDGQRPAAELPDGVRLLLIERVVPGTSALCLVTRAPVTGRLCAALQRRGADVRVVPLDAQTIARLRCGAGCPAAGEPLTEGGARRGAGAAD